MKHSMINQHHRSKRCACGGGLCYEREDGHADLYRCVECGQQYHHQENGDWRIEYIYTLTPVEARPGVGLASGL